MPSSTASPTSSSTAAASSPASGGGGGGSSSPLLFFVALGFGVVFTNLWIIVGVKYCFRYNQRNRALGRGPHVDGDPIDLTVMARPHRRRREKKLMTVEDMNNRFPLIKYKAWRASREHEGLPAAGGIISPPSRANSIKDVEGMLSDSKSRNSNDQDRPTSSLSQTPRTALPTEASQPRSIPEHEPIAEKSIIETTDIPASEKKTATTGVATISAAQSPADASDDDDDDDPIADAASPEMLSVPGDTCAICLDTLEDHDDVRGLTCGHAFHGACIEPWLTARRASCPLCKADYHVPKPQAEGATDNTTSSRRNQSRMNLPQSPRNAWMGMPARTRIMMFSSNRDSPARAPQDTTAGSTEQAGWRSRIPGNPFRRNNNASTTPATTTPAQLEAGTR